MGIKVYFTSVTASRTVKAQQTQVMHILDSKIPDYERIDISVSGELLEEMRNKCGDPKALPPQIFNDDKYCGNGDMFLEAVETDNVEQFLKLA